MDTDLEDFYDDEGETYDTPCKIRRDLSSQHQSTPTLPSSNRPNSFVNVHSSAPNLENDGNRCNIPGLNSLQQYPKVPKPGYEEVTQEVYMNTTFNAEKILSRKNSVISFSSGNNIHNNNKHDESKEQLLGDVPMEEYYMSPPPVGQTCPDDEETPVFYDAPSKNIDSRCSLPPLPPCLDPLSVHVADNITNDCIYQGIDDGDINNFYEGINEHDSNNFYDGLEENYEGLKENYEGLGNESDQEGFYEGVSEPVLSHEDEVQPLKSLMHALSMKDTPYIPPKPPPVPIRYPTKLFQPLPEIPQPEIQNTTETTDRVQEDISSDPLQSSVGYLESTARSKSCNGTVQEAPSIGNKISPNETESDDGFYDGIECESSSEDDCVTESPPKMRRSYSVRVIRKSVKRTRARTASQLENLKETISSTIQDRKDRWKDSKTRQDIKSVFKETKLKAGGLVTGTEQMYNTGKAALKKRSRSRNKEHRSCSVNNSETWEPEESDNLLAAAPSELEESPTFQSLPEATNGSEPAEELTFLDLESSNTSDNRSSLTGSSRGRIQSLISQISSDSKHSVDHIKRGSIDMKCCAPERKRDSFDQKNGSVDIKRVSQEQRYVDEGGLVGLQGTINQSLEIQAEITKPRLTSYSYTGTNTALMTERHKILQRILDHEYRYIISLKDIMKVYAQPLQQTHSNKGWLDPGRAQEIFFRIPEITVHHEFFYEALRRRSLTWSNRQQQSIGDILIQLFHKPVLFGAYASYIDNHHHALEIVREARYSRPAFSKFLDKLRNKSNQLSLEDLISLPVNHIPEYLELLKDLIKHTGQEHPDYTYLYMAQDEVEKLIDKLSTRKTEADKSFSVAQLERRISGLPISLIVPQRYIVSEEKLREMDIMTDNTADRILVVMTDLVVCLKPMSSKSSTVISSSMAAEYQYIWDCLLTDLKIISEQSDKHNDTSTDDTIDIQQTLKDDLDILENIDSLRKQLKGSYTSLRLDKLGEIKDKLKREIAERQFSEESRRGRILDVIRPVNSPCTSTQFHRFLFNSASKRSAWLEDFLKRQDKLQHTKDLDWCQVGEADGLPPERLATLLPSIKSMLSIGLSTPDEISVECAAANADFTCPVTQDILYRIMSTEETHTGHEKYANVQLSADIPLLPPGPAPKEDTLLYDEDLTPTVPHPHKHFPPRLPRQNTAPGLLNRQSSSPYVLQKYFSVDEMVRSHPNEMVRSHPSEIVVPPVPGNHPLGDILISNPSVTCRDLHEQVPVSYVSTNATFESNLSTTAGSDRKSMLEMMKSLPKEFDLDENAHNEEDNIYETPHEISLLRAQKKELLRSISADESANASTIDTSNIDISIIDTSIDSAHQQVEKRTEETEKTSDGENTDDVKCTNFSHQVADNLIAADTPTQLTSEVAHLNDTKSENMVSKDVEPDFDDISLPLDLNSPLTSYSTSFDDLTDAQKNRLTMTNSRLGSLRPPILNKLSSIQPDESFNLELTESRDLAFLLQNDKDEANVLSTGASESLLVDKYGHVYTDKISGLITGVPHTGPNAEDAPESPLSSLDEFDRHCELSLVELDSQDEDDTPLYDEGLRSTEPPIAPESINTVISQETVQGPSSLNSDISNLEQVPLPIIEAANSEISELLASGQTGQTTLYENMSATTQKLSTTVIRRESSKRSIGRKPVVTSRGTPANSSDNLSDEWQEPDFYENLGDDENFLLQPTDVFLCGHDKDGVGEVAVLRLTEPTPHVIHSLKLAGSQVLCCAWVPGNNSRNTLWIGTQDARLLVYQMATPNSPLIERALDGGPVTCIAHIEDSVFVGTSDGVLSVFTRDLTVNEWAENEPLSKKLGSHSICSMLPIGTCMWCSCGSQIFVISHRSVTVEHLFSTHNNTSAQVYKMVNCGSGIWLAIRNSPVIRLFHAKTGEHLQDYDISTIVHHLFTGSQNASRRRKSENVRVTALMSSAATSALWIGTSAGVIVVVPIIAPPVAPKINGPPFLSYVGHYDGVRFLIQGQSRIQKVLSKPYEDEIVYEEVTSQVVISGGKGREDYRDLASDSNIPGSNIQAKSHLIIWHYPSLEPT